MKRRLSVVDNLNMGTIAFSAVLEVGDSNMILPYSRALAVQREQELFFGNEGNFNNPIFYQPIPKQLITEQITIQRKNESPQIYVQSISITATAFSSVVHIGSTNLIETEARVKHIRHLKDYNE